MKFLILFWCILIVCVYAEHEWVSGDGNVYVLDQYPARKEFPSSRQNSSGVPSDKWRYNIVLLEERCEVCLTWISNALLILNTEFGFVELIGALTGACSSPFITSFVRRSLRKAKRPREIRRPVSQYDSGKPGVWEKDESRLCYDLLDTIGEAAAYTIWAQWDKLYGTGEFPHEICTRLSSCI